MKKLIKYFGIFFLPFALFTILYFAQDPFKVLYNYDSLYIDNAINPVYLNKDHVSTQTLINNTSKFGNNYNSFIIGNSKTVFLNVSDWSSKIKENANHCFHFDASAETLIGLRNKIEFLDKNNYKIKNALILLDYSTLNKDYLGDRQLNINSYLNTKEINPYYFQYVHLKTFFNAKFFFPYTLYLLQGKKLSDFMYTFKIFDDKKIKYNTITNELRYPEVDSLISIDKYHTNKKLAELADIKETIAPMAIVEPQKKLLNDIKQVLQKQGSNYVIIIPPSFDKMKLAPDDVLYLQQQFGENNVYDFSGSNNITNNKKMYYEQTHFIPQVWSQVLDSVYNNRATFSIKNH